ncbi:MAG: hypothetical protein ACXVQ7_07895 [Actinomycetota bacterium]
MPSAPSAEAEDVWNDDGARGDHIDRPQSELAGVDRHDRVGWELRRDLRDQAARMQR